MTKRYSELILIPTYFERLNYLRCYSVPYGVTFGPNRYLNQEFYHSIEWYRTRDQIILRDNGCDLGIRELPIRGKIIVHHLNPITVEDIYCGSEILINPENLICCSLDTHNAIHYIPEKKQNDYQERSPNDMCPWRR